jgi:beta-1,4-mannosyl-glycoprotein beta-1,4-N-acetylglucosaminyltransferase
MRGLVGCAPDDVIIISDVDEIPPGALVDSFAQKLKTTPMFCLIHKMYRYYLNRFDPERWRGTGVTSYGTLAKICPQEVRQRARFDRNLPCLEAGWHFTSMGEYNRVTEKWNGIAEWHYRQNENFEKWRAEVRQHALVPIDSSFPKYVCDNIGKLTRLHLIDVTNE